MKAYRFRFEKLLKSKKTIIDDLAAKTARAQKILLMERRKLQILEEGRGECLDRLASLQVGEIDASEIERCHRYLHHVQEAARTQAGLVREIDLRVQMLRNMLVETEKEKKMLEKLDEREQELFLRDFLQKEQAALDEIAINKYAQQNALHYARLPQQS
jgi:flagellar FliJ protein